MERWSDFLFFFHLVARLRGCFFFFFFLLSNRNTLGELLFSYLYVCAYVCLQVLEPPFFFLKIK